MLIAIDYDGTYSEDEQFWYDFVKKAIMRGHEVVCITMRKPDETLDDMPCEVIYTSRSAKRNYAESLGYYVDIWIDYSPQWILTDSK